MNQTLSERYIRAAHGVNHHEAGYIDAYFGNPAWSVPNSSNLKDLETELEELQDNVANLEPDTRKAFLQTQIKSMQTMVKLKSGTALSFLEEAKGLYDIEPIHKPESIFEAAHQTLEQLLPGTGSIADRSQISREKFRINTECLQPVIDVINLELQARSRKLFNLQTDESCEFKLVQDKPWGGYNWYLGSGRSRIEINTDLPKYLTGLPDLVAHEGYPGHHTEHIVKEKLLLQGNDWQEFSIQLLNSPESVLAEGIATSALEVVISKPELITWISEELNGVAGLKLTHEEVTTEFKLNQAREALGYVQGNAALLYFQSHENDQTILEYLQHYKLSSLSEARKGLEFIKHARAYVYTYTTGYDLLQNLFLEGNKITWFKQLLEQPATPSQLRTWANVGNI